LRAFSANALGYIGDPKAVAPLCNCRNATHNPADTWEIISALGRIGGDEAFDCLSKIVTTGFYNPEDLPNSDYKFEVRWLGFRWMILAAPPGRAGEIAPLIDSNDAKVKEEVEKAGWKAGIAVLDQCKTDAACYEKILADTSKGWFEREVAAFNFARLSKKGDAEAATKIARAFKLRDAEGRVNIAWLTAYVAGETPCHECAKALEDVMKAEELTKDANMQAPWLMARQTIAKVAAGAGSSD
jgi:hypothetical protein